MLLKLSLFPLCKLIKHRKLFLQDHTFPCIIVRMAVSWIAFIFVKFRNSVFGNVKYSPAPLLPRICSFSRSSALFTEWWHHKHISSVSNFCCIWDLSFDILYHLLIYEIDLNWSNFLENFLKERLVISELWKAAAAARSLQFSSVS